MNVDIIVSNLIEEMNCGRVFDAIGIFFVG